MEYLASHSDSLIQRVTNNLAESANSIICHLVLGKRVNLGLKHQYNTRVYAATVQHNTQQALTDVYNATEKKVPSLVMQADKTRQRKVLRTKLSRRMKARKRKSGPWTKGDRHYGMHCQKPDKTTAVLELEREKLFKRLTDNQAKREVIQKQTIDQRRNSTWQSLHKVMLTASSFGKVCRWKEETKCRSIVRSILYPPDLSHNEAVQYGIREEQTAKKVLRSVVPNEIEDCGLFIDGTYPYLAASPDALLGDNAIIEIKCPWSAVHLPAMDAVTDVKTVSDIFDRMDLEKMNVKHDYYFQVQGQLHITQREYCVFVVHTPQSQYRILVERDDDFWREKMEKQLNRFYLDCLLPEILDSRENRSMHVREPEYALAALRRKENIKNKNEETRIMSQKRKNENKLEIAEEEKKVRVSEDSSEIIFLNAFNHLPTDEEKASFRAFFDSREIDLEAVETNVLPMSSQLNDDALDCFMNLLKRNTNEFEIQSVLYITSPECVQMVDKPSTQIIGGNSTGHWRTIFFDGCTIHLYDSLTPHRLHATEEAYITNRFSVGVTNVIFERMITRQPDSTSCGI